MDAGFTDLLAPLFVELGPELGTALESVGMGVNVVPVVVLAALVGEEPRITAMFSTIGDLAALARNVRMGTTLLLLVQGETLPVGGETTELRVEALGTTHMTVGVGVVNSRAISSTTLARI